MSRLIENQPVDNTSTDFKPSSQPLSTSNLATSSHTVTSTTIQPKSDPYLVSLEDTNTSDVSAKQYFTSPTGVIVLTVSSVIVFLLLVKICQSEVLIMKLNRILKQNKVASDDADSGFQSSEASSPERSSRKLISNRRKSVNLYTGPLKKLKIITDRINHRKNLVFNFFYPCNQFSV